MPDQTQRALQYPLHHQQVAHVLEGAGLALTGAACGLFVAAPVATARIDLIDSAGAVLAMMLYDAAGYLAQIAAGILRMRAKATNMS